MKIPWRDECKYCLNKKDCVYIEHTKNFKEALYYMGKSAKGVHGSLIFRCNYFILDKKEYWKNNIGETNE